MKKAAVFLDRDGVINKTITKDGKPYPPKDIHDVEIIEGVKEACEKFKNHGILCIVVTNQPDIARNIIPKKQVDLVNQWIDDLIGFDDIYVCPHDDPDQCDCRKPKPGMIHQAAQKWDIDLKKSVMVGDRWRDIEAGEKAGCKTVFIDYNYNEKQPDNPDLIVKNLGEATSWIINNT